MKHRTELSITALVGVAALICLISCGTWKDNAGKGLRVVQTMAKEASAKVEPHYRSKCRVIAAKCPGLPCPALEKCQAERAKINSAIKATHHAVKAMTEVLPLIEAVREASK